MTAVVYTCTIQDVRARIVPLVVWLVGCASATESGRSRISGTTDEIRARCLRARCCVTPVNCDGAGKKVIQSPAGCLVVELSEEQMRKECRALELRAERQVEIKATANEADTLGVPFPP